MSYNSNLKTATSAHHMSGLLYTEELRPFSDYSWISQRLSLL